MVNTLNGGYDSIIFAGHSLGGTGAFCLAMAFPESTCVCFNPGFYNLIIGAAPSNPIYTGPGPLRATVYHIVGDIISSHISERACLLYRVKIDVPFGSKMAHESENFFSSKSYTYITATVEDELFLKWIKGYSLAGNFYGTYIKYLQKQAEYKPIPDSYRDQHPTEYDRKGNKKSKWAIVNSVRNILNNV